MPATWTWLFLTPSEYPPIPESVKKEYEQFNTTLRIPVSPASMTFRRDADHNEVYGIARGGLLQRNLPKLWHTAIESYIPRRLFDREFHNTMVTTTYEDYLQGRRKQFHVLNRRTEYTQQKWVDYINLIMERKQVLTLWEESSTYRLFHECTQWCITHFEYKINPHDDIDFKLDLVEWREPKALVGEATLVEKNDPEPPKKAGGGNRLLVFGSYDNRAHNMGSVYPPAMTALVTMDEKRAFGIQMKSDLDLVLYGNHTATTHRFGNMTANVGVVDSDRYSVVLSKPGGWQLPISIPNGQYTPSQLVSKYGIARESLRVEEKEVFAKTAVLDAIYARARKLEQTNISVVIGANQSVEGNNRSVQQEAASRQTPSSGKYNGVRHLWYDAWCDKLKTLKNVQNIRLRLELYAEPTYTVSNSVITTVGFPIVIKQTSALWYKTMYVVRPHGGKEEDLIYERVQTWLVPKENTTPAGYKAYLKTVEVNWKSDSNLGTATKLGLNTPRTDTNFGTGEKKK